jgi:hypothetical protein
MASVRPRFGTARRGPDDFSAGITAACVAAAVSIGLAGCGYPCTSGLPAGSWWSPITSTCAPASLAVPPSGSPATSEMQRSCDVLARHALACAPGGDEERVQVTVLPVWQFDQYTPDSSRRCSWRQTG